MIGQGTGEMKGSDVALIVAVGVGAYYLMGGKVQGGNGSMGGFGGILSLPGQVAGGLNTIKETISGGTNTIREIIEKPVEIIKSIIKEVPIPGGGKGEGESGSTAPSPETPKGKGNTSERPPSEADFPTYPGAEEGLGLTDVGVLGTLRAGAGIAARQYAGTFLTGTHLIRPMPLAKGIETLGKTLLPKVAVGAGAKLGVKIGTRAIPVIGWGLMGVDLGADILRLFGADVPELLGFSSLFSPLNKGRNPLETWVSGVDKKNQLQSRPLPYQIASKEADTGAPEKPELDLRDNGGMGKYVPWTSDRPTAKPQPIPAPDYWG